MEKDAKATADGKTVKPRKKLKERLLERSKNVKVSKKAE